MPSDAVLANLSIAEDAQTLLTKAQLMNLVDNPGGEVVDVTFSYVDAGVEKLDMAA